MNFFKLIILISPKIFFVISSLLLIYFIWLYFHKFIFDNTFFFITKKLGIRFPRSSLTTRSSSIYFSGSSIFSKVPSALVSVKLNSLVDLKNTNIYLVNNSFSKMTSFVYKKLKYKPSRKWSSIKGLTSPVRYYSLYSKLKRSFYNASLVHKLNRFSSRSRFSKFNSRTKRPLVSSGYSSKLRFLKFKGSILFPKLISNKLDLNTFILRELLIKKTNFNFFDNYGIDDKKSSLNFYHQYHNKNLSIPTLSVFHKNDFFFKTNNPNSHFFKNRNSNILSDLFYPFLRYKLNRALMRDPTFYRDSALSKRRSGGSLFYKNLYTYNISQLQTSHRFLNHSKIYGSFIRQNVKVLPLNSFSKTRSLKLLKKETLYWKRAFQRKSFWRRLVRTAYRRNFRRLIRRKFIYTILSKGYRLSKKSRRVRVRFAKRRLRKFIFTRFFF